MKYIDTGEAKANFSKLLAAVRRGEEVTICGAGKPVARLTAFESEHKMPKLGTGRDKVKFQPGWDSPETDAEIMEMFDVLKGSDRRRDCRPGSFPAEPEDAADSMVATQLPAAMLHIKRGQSGFTSAAFTTSVHFFSSAAVWAASSAGEDGWIS